MRCPSLEELPAPPPGRSGWPWTEDTRAVAREGRSWPRVSVVTLSLNRARYIEEAIRSILLQGYPDLEYIVIDGGSTDGTIEILERYSRWITYWISEPDRGTAHAANKALREASGDLMLWLSTDDVMLPGALVAAASCALEHPGSVIAAAYCHFDEASGTRTLRRQRDVEFPRLLKFWEWQFDWNSAACVLPVELLRRIGPLDESIRVVCDYEYFCRILQHATVQYIAQPILMQRLHADSLTSGEQRHRMMFGVLQTVRRYLHFLSAEEQNDYRRIVSRQVFALGLGRLKVGDPEAARFILEALRVSPFWAIAPYVRYRWIRMVRALRGRA